MIAVMQETRVRRACALLPLGYDLSDCGKSLVLVFKIAGTRFADGFSGPTHHPLCGGSGADSSCPTSEIFCPMSLSTCFMR